MFDDYIDFINYVFGMNGTSEGFPKLLPKLYKPEYHPCENNYVVTVDGKLKSAISLTHRPRSVLRSEHDALYIHALNGPSRPREVPAVMPCLRCGGMM